MKDTAFEKAKEVLQKCVLNICPHHDEDECLEAADLFETAARKEGAREALLKVIAEDVHPMPRFDPDVPKMHGPCHPSDGSRMCAAHRVLVFDYPAEPLPPGPEA